MSLFSKDKNVMYALGFRGASHFKGSSKVVSFGSAAKRADSAAKADTHATLYQITQNQNPIQQLELLMAQLSQPGVSAYHANAVHAQAASTIQNNPQLALSLGPQMRSIAQQFDQAHAAALTVAPSNAPVPTCACAAEKALEAAAAALTMAPTAPQPGMH